jgi:hypothetical protein
MVSTTKELGPENDYAGEVQQHIQKTIKNKTVTVKE